MNIKHPSIFDTAEVERIYTEKDGVPVKYVCTTDVRMSDVPVDVYYRETPHPEFGNRYFGLFVNGKEIFITNADEVEDMEFGMIQDKDGAWWYSSSHHDCIFIDGQMIDGGREYIRSKGNVTVFKIKNGEFVEWTPSQDQD